MILFSITLFLFQFLFDLHINLCVERYVLILNQLVNRIFYNNSESLPSVSKFILRIT